MSQAYQGIISVRLGHSLQRRCSIMHLEIFTCYSVHLICSNSGEWTNECAAETKFAHMLCCKQARNADPAESKLEGVRVTRIHAALRMAIDVVLLSCRLHTSTVIHSVESDMWQ